MAKPTVPMKVATSKTSSRPGPVSKRSEPPPPPPKSPAAKAGTSKLPPAKPTPNRVGSGKVSAREMAPARPSASARGSANSGGRESGRRGDESRDLGAPASKGKGQQQQMVLFASIAGGALVLVVLLAIMFGGKSQGRTSINVPNRSNSSQDTTISSSHNSKPVKVEDDPFKNEKRDKDWKPNALSNRGDRIMETMKEKQANQNADK